MKNWFTTAVLGEKEDGTKYTICTQKFFVDDDRVLTDLSAVFANCGIGLAGAPLRAYIAKNSVSMASDKGVRLPMVPVNQVGQIVMGALAAGYGEKPNIQDAMAYVTHLTNVLAKNAMGAYAAEVAKVYAVPSDAAGSQGDDET